jgi:hypothetical protein
MLLHFFKRFSRMLSYVLVACHPGFRTHYFCIREYSNHATFNTFLLNHLWELQKHGIKLERALSNASRLSNACVAAVGNSPLFLDESPFRTIRQIFQPGFVIGTFDELFEMEIRPKIGVSCRRLVCRGKPILQIFYKIQNNASL